MTESAHITTSDRSTTINPSAVAGAVGAVGIAATAIVPALTYFAQRAAEEEHAAANSVTSAIAGLLATLATVVLIMWAVRGPGRVRNTAITFAVLSPVVLALFWWGPPPLILGFAANRLAAYAVAHGDHTRGTRIAGLVGLIVTVLAIAILAAVIVVGFTS
jgi:hypothetical protein